ncbi:MAG: MFS transporter [archaeon]
MHLHLHIHRIHFLRKELSEVYLNLSLQSFAISLIAVFIPIYLLSLGYSLDYVIIYFIVYYGCLGLFAPLSALLANRFGLKHMIILRTPFLIIFLLGLHNITTLTISPLIISALGGFGSSLYWVSINSMFARHSDKLHRGTQSGNYISLPQIASLIGPTIGGFITLLYGFPALFLTAIAFIILSMLPLFMTPETKPHINYSFRKMINNKNYIKYATYFILTGPRFIAGAIFWPLFIYWGLSGSATGTGFSQTLTGVGVLAFTYYTARKSDKKGKTSLIKKGALLLALLWFARIYATSASEFYIYSFLAGLFTVLIDVPFTAASFDTANRENPDEFIVVREISIALGRVLTLGAILMFSGLFMRIIFSFTFAGTATLAFLLF